LKAKIAITSFASISPLGNDFKTIWQNYLSNKTAITSKNFNGENYFVATIPSEIRKEIDTLRKSEIKYKSLDETVLFAILTSRKAIENAGWKKGDDFGINIGSSRGATQLFEKHHQEFLATGKTTTLTSPSTTLGNISSWVAHDLKSKGPEISHSITCSTALHAILNAVAWLQSGLVNKFLVGGSEMPLTAFTIAQMNALKIYGKENQEYPCRSFDLEKTKNTMILGEAAAMACLEIEDNQNAIAYIVGIGYATDDLDHSISISEEGICFQKAMKMALKNTKIADVDVIVMHAPGTIKGDLSEFNAIKKLFGEHLPMLTTNKWKIGHTFGASGMMSIEFAILMMQNNFFIRVPFNEKQKEQKEIKKVLINAVGFGGNAVSILLTKD
jgi:3-oxoacyl-(acyl-carrier-protein) synthase